MRRTHEFLIIPHEILDEATGENQIVYPLWCARKGDVDNRVGIMCAIRAAATPRDFCDGYFRTRRCLSCYRRSCIGFRDRWHTRVHVLRAGELPDVVHHVERSVSG